MSQGQRLACHPTDSPQSSGQRAPEHVFAVRWSCVGGTVLIFPVCSVAYGSVCELRCLHGILTAPPPVLVGSQRLGFAGAGALTFLGSASLACLLTSLMKQELGAPKKSMGMFYL